MTLIVVLLAAAGFTAGILLVVAGIHGTHNNTKTTGSSRARLAEISQLRLRIGLAVLFAGAMAFLAPWPVAIALAGFGGFSTPTLLGAQKRRRSAVARTEAVATWAEQLRDTMGSAAGLQEAITTTARVAPKEIRTEVQALALGMRRHPLGTMMRRFATDIDDPAADQVAVALILASERRGENLTVLLSDVAEAARQEAMMRMRTETSRAQTYSDAKAVTMIVLTVFGLLLVMSRGYLDPFNSATGQFVLAMVGAMWVGAVYGLVKLSEVRRGPRILSLTESDRELI